MFLIFARVGRYEIRRRAFERLHVASDARRVRSTLQVALQRKIGRTDLSPAFPSDWIAVFYAVRTPVHPASGHPLRFLLRIEPYNPKIPTLNKVIRNTLVVFVADALYRFNPRETPHPFTRRVYFMRASAAERK
jgi:hypothetical protein